MRYVEAELVAGKGESIIHHNPTNALLFPTPHGTFDNSTNYPRPSPRQKILAVPWQAVTAAESQILSLPAESQILSLAAESQILSLAAESQILSLAAESQILSLAAESQI